MKHTLTKLALVLTVLLVVFAAVSCDSNVSLHKHNIGNWQIVTAPTETEEGKIQRTCESDIDCSYLDELTVPALSDTDFWTLEVDVPATHLNVGHKEYSCEYLTYAVVLDVLTDHVYGAWTITTDPTYTETGIAERVCVCGEKDTHVLPALTDEFVWTKTGHTAPTVEAQGTDTYASEFGIVVVTHEYTD